MSAADSAENVAEGIGVMLSAAATFLGIILVVGFFTTGPIFAGILGGLDSAAAWTLVVAAVAYIGSQTDDLSVGFAFSFIAILMLLSTVLPDWLTRPFAFISQTLLGRTLGDIDPVAFAVLVFATIGVFWAVRIRLFGRGKKPSTVTKRMRTKAEQLTREYATITRVIFAFAFSVVLIFASQGGELFGELSRSLASAPVVSGYAATLIGGFGSFIAGWPVVGGVDPTLFGIIAVAVFVIAVGVKYQ